MGHEAAHRSRDAAPDAAARPQRRAAPTRADAVIALQRSAGNRAVAALLQRSIDVTAGSFADLIAEQRRYQSTEKQAPGSYEDITTVGFEHEFAQMEGDDLAGLTHLELVKSNETLPYTEMPFLLETDADNALELVSPPFLVKVVEGSDQPIPDLADVHKIDTLIKSRLSAIAGAKPTMSQLIGLLRDDPKLTFPLTDVEVKRKNVTGETKGDYHKGASGIGASTIGGIKVKPSTKGSAHHHGPAVIGSQVNFATTAEVYDRMQQLAPPETDGFELAYAELQGRLLRALLDARGRAPGGSDKIAVFLRILARTLSGQLAVASMEAFKERQEKLFDEPSKQERGRRRGHLQSPEGVFDRSMSSHVKDVGGSWLKDNVWNAGLGLLSPADWGFVHTIAADQVLIGAVQSLQPNPGLFKGGDAGRYRALFGEAVAGVVTALGVLANKSQALSGGTAPKLAKTFADATNQVEFLGHDPGKLGPRQDTYIPGKKVAMPEQWAGKRLHVVETRGGPMRALVWLQADELMRTTDRTDAQIAEELGAVSDEPVLEKDIAAMRERAIAKLAQGNGLPPMAPAAIAQALHVAIGRVNAVLNL